MPDGDGRGDAHQPLPLHRRAQQELHGSLEGGPLGSRPADQGAAREKISGVGVGVGVGEGCGGEEGWEGGFGRGVGAWEFGLDSVAPRCAGAFVNEVWECLETCGLRPGPCVCRAFLGVFREIHNLCV